MDQNQNEKLRLIKKCMKYKDETPGVDARYLKSRKTNKTLSVDIHGLSAYI